MLSHFANENFDPPFGNEDEVQMVMMFVTTMMQLLDHDDDDDDDDDVQCSSQFARMCLD